MNTEESEWTIAALRREVAELEDRVAELEQRVGRHSCLIDCCEFDDDGDCMLRRRSS